MKIGVFLLLATCTLASASGYAQQVSLMETNSSLESIFKEIHAQTGYYFMYNERIMKNAKPVNINVTNAPLHDVLELSFEGQPFTYSIVDNIIVVTEQTHAAQQPPQPILINGTVKDEDGETLPGVTVRMKGTTAGTATNAEGKFQIATMDPDAIIVFSFVGKETKEVLIDGRTSIEVVMKSSVQELDQVVVTGYYVTDRKTFTGAATTITAAEIQQVGTTNFMSVLQTLDPSFRLDENILEGSNPNILPQIDVRGTASIPSTTIRDEFMGDPNMPTFIVDGFEESVERVFDLDPYLIESVTILKDASATAIYGSRAANGVVVIELKRPERGKLNVDYNLQYVLTAPDLTDYDLMRAEEKLELEVLSGHHDAPFSDPYNEIARNIAQGYDTYWLHQPLRVGHDASHSLGISGGDESFAYRLGYTRGSNIGVMKGSERIRNSISGNLTYRLPALNFSNTISYTQVDASNSPYGSFSTYAELNPYFRHTDDNGKYVYRLSETPSTFNPLWNAKLKHIDGSNYGYFSNNFSVNWNITKHWQLKTSASLGIRSGKSEQFRSALHTSYALNTNMNQRGSYSVNNTEEVNWQANMVLSHSRVIKKHFLTLNSGLNFTDNEGLSNGFSAQGFVSELLTDPSFANRFTDGSRPRGASTKSRMLGAFVNANYSFNDIYFADISYRGDISSRFGKDSRWAAFWSAGLGYNIHNESFMQNVDFIDLLRLRGSFGVTGSQNFDPYQSFFTYSFYSSAFYSGYSIGAEMMGMGNENLNWQKTHNYNIGLDAGFLNNRLVIGANRYLRRSKDLLVPVTIAPSLGFSSYMENLGEVDNTGFEISLRGTLIRTRDMQIALTISGSHNKNILKKISNSLAGWNEDQDRASMDGDTRPKVRFIEGESMRTIWVVRSLGIDPANGKELFLDNEGNRTYIWSPDLIVPYATSDPDLFGTTGLNISYKGLSVNSYMRFSIGGYQYNSTLVNRVENVDTRLNTDRRVFLDRWKEPGDQTYFKAIDDQTATRPTSRFVQKNNVVSMTSLNIGYQFRQEQLKNLPIKTLRLTFYMNDLFHFSTIRMERGLDYPFARTFNFSIQTRL